MPLPRWWRRINKHPLNPRELERGARPVLTHVGRDSGRTYRTPTRPRSLPVVALWPSLEVRQPTVSTPGNRSGRPASSGARYGTLASGILLGPHDPQ